MYVPKIAPRHPTRKRLLVTIVTWSLTLANASEVPSSANPCYGDDCKRCPLGLLRFCISPFRFTISPRYTCQKLFYIRILLALIVFPRCLWPLELLVQRLVLKGMSNLMCVVFYSLHIDAFKHACTAEGCVQEALGPFDACSSEVALSSLPFFCETELKGSPMACSEFYQSGFIKTRFGKRNNINKKLVDRLSPATPTSQSTGFLR